MNQLIEEFVESSEQIVKYCDLLKEVDRNQFHSDDPSKLDELLCDSDLIRTLNATLFLLLYNLIESTMRSGIEKIYDHLQVNDIQFNELKVILKKRILNDIQKKISVDELHNQTQRCIEKEIIRASFRSKKLFSGNIDREVIKDLADKFGFSTDSEYSMTKHGENLKDVKNKRNDLAHGNATFREVGSFYSVSDLESIMIETINYLEAILKNIKSYLDNNQYLHDITI